MKNRYSASNGTSNLENSVNNKKNINDVPLKINHVQLKSDDNIDGYKLNNDSDGSVKISDDEDD